MNSKESRWIMSGLQSHIVVQRTWEGDIFIYFAGMTQVSVSKARSIIVLSEVENADQVHKIRHGNAVMN